MPQRDEGDLPEIPIVLERADEFMGTGPDADAEFDEQLGDDRFGRVASAVSDAVDRQRGPDGPSRPGGGGSASGLSQLLPDRTAQVVQATLVPHADVLALLDDPAVARRPDAAIELWPAGVHDGDHHFDGSLRSGRFTRRAVTLRVYPTPSANLTVLELLPKRQWMPQTKRYLRAGVPAITALTDAIERSALPPESTG